MKFMHLSDLHLGKRVNEFSMTEDQEHILKEILALTEREKPDGVILAGDIYDKPVPTAEAVGLLDFFLTRLSGMGILVFLISGNHDSPERLSFGSHLMEKSGVYVAPAYQGLARPIELKDSYGSVFLYLLPFLKPAVVRRQHPQAEADTYDCAVRWVLDQIRLEENGFHPQERNVLAAHQFVAGASLSDSEEFSVGGLDQVGADAFDGFDYVALGHIHGPQKVGRETLRYCGAPLKYSFSEAGQVKSVTVVELLEKGNVKVSQRPLKPLRDMRRIRGSYEEVTARAFYQDACAEDYLEVILTDEEDILNALGRLRAIYPNIMKLGYDNRRSKASAPLEAAGVRKRSPMELFERLYEIQNNSPLSGEQREFLEPFMRELWEEIQ